MWIFEIEIEGNKGTGRTSALVIAEKSQVALEVLKENGLTPSRTQHGNLVDTISPHRIKQGDIILLSEKAKNSTTMYENIAEATGLKHEIK